MNRSINLDRSASMMLSIYIYIFISEVCPFFCASTVFFLTGVPLVITALASSARDR